jgi:hypothetical protein
MGGTTIACSLSLIVGSGPFSLQSHVLLAEVTLGLLVAGAVLGVWGMALLVRSYHPGEGAKIEGQSSSPN